MLQLLHIENIAVIEEADITFDEGFNALTGETGAGKSIVIDAMGAVLGQRTSRDLIRTGAAKAFVSAMFSGVPPLAALEECGLEAEDGELLLQREIYADGKNACRVGGRPVTVAQLRRIGGALLNIHGQHDGQQLLDEEQHGAYLDSFGRVEAELGAYAACYEAMEVTRKKLKSLQMDEAEKERRIDSLQFQISELERAQLRPGEEEDLAERKKLLRSADKLMGAIESASYALFGGEEGNGAVDLIGEAEGSLSRVSNLSEELGTLSESLTELRCSAEDAAARLRELGAYLRETYRHNLAENAQIAREENRITVRWETPVEVFRIVLMEDIARSQRVESFSILDGEGKTLYEGTVIGYKKIIPLQRCLADQITVRIRDSRGTPHIAFVGVY